MVTQQPTDFTAMHAGRSGRLAPKILETGEGTRQKAGRVQLSCAAGSGFRPAGASGVSAGHLSGDQWPCEERIHLRPGQVSLQEMCSFCFKLNSAQRVEHENALSAPCGGQLQSWN